MKKIVFKHKFTTFLTLVLLAMVIFLTVNYKEPIATMWNMQGKVTNVAASYSLFALLPLLWVVELMDSIQTSFVTGDFKKIFSIAMQLFITLMTGYILLYNIDIKIEFKWSILVVAIFSLGLAVLVVNTRKKTKR